MTQLMCCVTLPGVSSCHFVGSGFSSCVCVCWRKMVCDVLKCGAVHVFVITHPAAGRFKCVCVMTWFSTHCLLCSDLLRCDTGCLQHDSARVPDKSGTHKRLLRFEQGERAKVSTVLNVYCRRWPMSARTLSGNASSMQ